MSSSAIHEIDVWSEILGPDANSMPVPDANAILRWTFRDHAKARMDELATRNSEGTLSQAERQELDAYVHVGQVVAILQAKARLALKRAGENGAH